MDSLSMVIQRKKKKLFSLNVCMLETFTLRVVLGAGEEKDMEWNRGVV